MRKAFTLIELLVVIGIMGLLGTTTVAGYRAMQRGMEERGVMQNVNELIKTAYERAQIDRQPTAIYFWNETLRGSDDDENEIVVGRAVAVRRQGRLTRCDGAMLYDEFADLNKTYPTTESGDSESEDGGGDGSADAGDNTMYLYYLDNLGGGTLKLQRSVVSQRVDKKDVGETYLNGIPSDSTGSGGRIEVWGFKVEDSADSPPWRAGSSYGVEFAELTLPHGYIFGSTYSTDIQNPVEDAGTMLFRVGRNIGNGVTDGSTVEGSVTVYSLRPNASGALDAQKVNTNDNPY